MQTNIPALVCLSMIVSGCANQDLFDNWNNAGKPETVLSDMRITEMSECRAGCPFSWSEDFSNGLILTGDATASSFSVWKTSAATWILGHSGDPAAAAPAVSWSMCNRNTNISALCDTPVSAGKLSFISFGGILAAAASAFAYFPQTTTLSNIRIEPAFTNVSCGKTSDVCNPGNNPISNGRTFFERHHNS